MVAIRGVFLVLAGIGLTVPVVAQSLVLKPTRPVVSLYAPGPDGPVAAGVIDGDKLAGLKGAQAGDDFPAYIRVKVPDGLGSVAGGDYLVRKRDVSATEPCIAAPLGGPGGVSRGGSGSGSVCPTKP